MRRKLSFHLGGGELRSRHRDPLPAVDFRAAGLGGGLRMRPGSMIPEPESVLAFGAGLVVFGMPTSLSLRSMPPGPPRWDRPARSDREHAKSSWYPPNEIPDQHVP
jgi:hypothetical protein